jgi:protein O-GlcNAc transferase
MHPKTPPQPASASLQHRLAAALAHHQRGDVAFAEAAYREVLREIPRCFDALHLLGIALIDRGAADEGVEVMGRALAVDPSHAGAHYGLARALAAKGDQASALESVNRAIRIQPNLADAWFLRGNLLQQAGQFEQSVESYERAVALQPNFPEAFNNLAAALRALRKTQRAIECADRALTLKPKYAKAFNNRGLILLDCHRQSAAVDSFQRAITIEPEFAEASHNLGTALLQLRRFEDARDAFARLAAFAPNFHHVHGNLLYAKLNCCDWTGFDSLAEAVSGAVARGEHADVPMSFLNISGSARLQLRCAQIYTDAHYPARAAEHRRVTRKNDGRIRIAYLSGDFGEHAVTYLLAGVLARHDLSRFETIGLSWDRAGEGSTRHRVEAAFSRFIDITAAGDAEVVQLMQELQVDIAVDLSGHTLGQRTGILARRAAPVQVNYLGLPATMGARYMDYLIADAFLVPEAHRIHYAEQVVWLPCFQPNDDRRKPPPGTSRAQHGLPEAGFIFCSFNNNTKINPGCFDIWMRLLESVPGSVLWMLADAPLVADNLRREAVSRGADASRLIFAKRAAYDDYLARYAHADLFLDSVPFNGGTTASDALSMGVPVLTCAGESFSARMAGSLLSGLELPELVTASLSDYESMALDLANSPMRLRALRQRLVQARPTHPFFDTDRYRRHLESAYQTMWERSAAGLAPAAFAVAP